VRAAALVAAVAALAVVGGLIGAYLYVNTQKAGQPHAMVKSEQATMPDDAGKKKAEADRQEKEARAEAERVAKAERDRVEKQKRDEEDERNRQRLLEEKRKLDAEKERKPRARLQDAPLKPAEPPVIAAVPSETPAPAPKPQPECPRQGEVAIYNCYRELARGGDALAALKVGELFEAGRGVAKSNNTAYYWYAVSELRCASGAKAKKDAVAKRLQPLEIDQMDRLAKNEVRSGQCQPG
jgi:TPR repeat protein